MARKAFASLSFFFAMRLESNEPKESNEVETNEVPAPAPPNVEQMIMKSASPSRRFKLGAGILPQGSIVKSSTRLEPLTQTARAS